VRLTEEQAAALKRYAAWRRTPVAWLVKDYVTYLLQGGELVVPAAAARPEPVEEDQLPVTELALLAERGGAFDWLDDEPDLYSASDGEAV
jgi:hypothetical protein